MRLQMQTWQELNTEGNSLQYDPSQMLLAVGGSDGTKTIYTVPLGKITSSIPGYEQKVPTTCVKYKKCDVDGVHKCIPRTKCS